MYYIKTLVLKTFLFEIYLDYIKTSDNNTNDYKNMFDYIFGHHFLPNEIDEKIKRNIFDKHNKIQKLYDEYCINKNINNKNKLVFLSNELLELFLTNNKILEFGNSLVQEDNTTVKNIIINYSKMTNTIP